LLTGINHLFKFNAELSLNQRQRKKVVFPALVQGKKLMSKSYCVLAGVGALF
jgi:hypothetical protein